MELKYNLSAINKEVIKTCDEANSEFQGLMIEMARIVNPFLIPLMWIITRFYKKTVTNKYISYDYYLLRTKKKSKTN